MTRRYQLKRPVVIGVRWVEEKWAPRVLWPAAWQAQIEVGGPRTFRDVAQRGHTRKAAVIGLIRRMQADGYTGVARDRYL